MKKTVAMMMTAILVLTASAVGSAEAAPGPFSAMEEQVFEFSSGAGAWSTELYIEKDGSFTGVFNDGEMGETGEGYPDGTVYGCTFHGVFSDPVQADEYTWTAKVTVEMDEGQVPEVIEDGIRYITTAPYGLEKAKSVTFFLPGTPVERLPEDFMIWSHLDETDPDAKVIPYYAIWNEADEAGFVSYEVPAEGEISDSIRNRITGNIEDGSYVLTVPVDPDDTGEWRADEMAQDPSVVRLAASGVENGVFTARYEPTGNGDISVCLRHFTAHNACDEMHTFDLRVKDGKVVESFGGSMFASPKDEDIDPFLTGEWLEKDTQFTSLSAVRNPEGGWDVTITSPLSHGAWVIRGTAYHDCDYDALVYADGVKYDLVPGDETAEKEAATGLWGTLKFSEAMGRLQLVWYDMENTGSETVIFERSAAGT